jgi:alkylmercury lyase
MPAQPVTEGQIVIQTDELGQAIRALMPKLTMEESSVALDIYRGLVKTGTVSVGTLCERTGLDPSRVEAILAPWPGVFRDELHNITGFWGLTAKPVSKHRLRFNGQDRYAWCAWDCLFLPALLRQSVHVDSVCRQTDEPISLTVSPGGIEKVQPRSTALSMLVPDVERCRHDVVSNFCHFVFFFKDEAAGRTWTATHPGTQAITLEQGLALGRMKNEWQFGAGP